MSNQSKRRDRFSALYFVASLCFFSVLLGMAIWEKQWFPYSIILGAVNEFTNLSPRGRDRELADEKSDHPPHLSPVRYPSPGVRVGIEGAAAPGLTLLTGHWPESDWQPGIRLIDLDGKILHSWTVKPRRIWPLQSFPLGTYVHGTYLFPNGDILFNVEYAGLARMNACGDILWKSKFKTHHSVFRAEDGNFWVSGYRRIEEGDERAKEFRPMAAPFGEESLYKISPDGKVLQEISLLESLYNSEYKHLLWHYERILAPHRRIDPLHLNDVEVLSSALADDYPTLDTGDIVVSLRELNLVTILNPQGGIKWASIGVFTRQHDPDFEAGGWITVFDNRSDGTERKGLFLGGSAIRQIKPETGEIRNIYDSSTEKKRFFTSAGGKHQLLDNGNRLITEARAGRVFEVNPNGETVWQWIAEPYSDTLVAEVLEGTRYPKITAADVAEWGCSGEPR